MPDEDEGDFPGENDAPVSDPGVVVPALPNTVRAPVAPPLLVAVPPPTIAPSAPTAVSPLVAVPAPTAMSSTPTEVPPVIALVSVTMPTPVITSGVPAPAPTPAAVPAPTVTPSAPAPVPTPAAIATTHGTLTPATLPASDRSSRSRTPARTSTAAELSTPRHSWRINEDAPASSDSMNIARLELQFDKPEEDSPPLRRWKRVGRSKSPEADHGESGVGGSLASPQENAGSAILDSSPTLVQTNSAAVLNQGNAQALAPAPIPESTIALPKNLDGRAKWPKHAKDAYEFLMKTGGEEGRERKWGASWEECVNEFIEFQKRSGFPDASDAYPAAGRPEEIKGWMKAHRAWKEVQVDTSFGGKVMEWWALLQPAGPASVSSDWTKLRKAGKNGLFLVLLSLVWWGHSCSRGAEWFECVGDVTRSIRFMRMSMPADKSDSGGAGKSVTKRKRGVKENDVEGMKVPPSKSRRTR